MKNFCLKLVLSTFLLKLILKLLKKSSLNLVHALRIKRVLDNHCIQLIAATRNMLITQLYYYTKLMKTGAPSYLFYIGPVCSGSYTTPLKTDHNNHI